VRSSGSSTGLENHDLTDRDARYMHIVGHGNTGNESTSISETDVHGEGGGGGDCEVPADVLDLTDWYVGLPIGDEESPTNVKQPQLDSFSVDPWFTTAADCAGVQFRSAVNGSPRAAPATPAPRCAR
jgi:hypothetical protein